MGLIRICCQCKYEIDKNNDATEVTQDEIIEFHKELQAFFNQEIELSLTHTYCKACLAEFMEEIKSNQAAQ